MKKQIFFIIVLSLITHNNYLHAAPSHILSLFFTWYPSLDNEKTRTEYPEGIPVTYYGNKTTSNRDGHASFPLYQSIPKLTKGKKLTFYLLVCSSIDPLFMLHATIERFVLPKGVSYRLYVIEKTYDKDTQKYVWTVQKARLADNTIPLKTIIIHTEAQEIEIPTGISITNESSHIILPPILVKPSMSEAKSNITFLQNNKFFGPINRPTATATPQKPAS